MNTNTNNTKVIVPCRFSYLHCWEPDSVNGGDPKYSVSAIVPKSDKATVEAIKAAIEQAKKDSVSKWGGKIPGNLKTPLRDGDIDRPDDEAYKGCYWILELGELAGIKKVDVETVKSFITRTDDKFRQSYGVTVESHPRNNIIVGSTNSESGFLRDITGNRRFWPVLVSGKDKRSVWDITPELVDQFWAEAIVKYRDGEDLFLKGDVAALAYEAQQVAMEADDREGVVSDYLGQLLPENWDAMDLYQRRSFLGGSEFDGAAANGTVRRERVCIMEIWCECFCKERQNLKRTDSYEIESILNRIGGWTLTTATKTGKTSYALYGPQRTFIRVDSGTSKDR